MIEKKFLIREMKKSEYNELENFLYEAIFIPENVLPPPREIIFQPELQVYIKNFGEVIATALMKNLIEKIFANNFQQISLSVQKNNFIAVELYKKLGFKIFREIDEEFIMILKLRKKNVDTDKFRTSSGRM